ncbi:MAG: ATP-dependent DNA helicase RecG [Candidatus Doudnabacteria bacterium]|nr:ATP-dependent DNA helicase RecG [bacterium]MDZ4243620.1 ATP-dependent DNA helicase RecG [Candidatus Doudnabacteria bacterium]
MLSLNDPITKLRLVGPANEKALNHLGIRTIRDLLNHFPRAWEDLTQIQTISEIRPNEKINLKARVRKIADHSARFRRMHLTEGLIEDETGSVIAIWFNQPFIKNLLQEGKEYYFSGKAQFYKEKLQFMSPTFEAAKEDTIHTAGIIPTYELTEGITQKQIRYWLKSCLPLARLIEDYLPSSIREKLGLPNTSYAVSQIHFPSSKESLEKARRRLAFGELFLFQLALASFKQKIKSLSAPRILFDVALVKKFVASLPFRLTSSQRLAAWEILKDLAAPHPMNRLLEGEVGSGKTVVAGIAMLEAAKAGWQSVLLSPTEILAWQHYHTLQNLFEKSGLQIALLTGSRKIGSPSDIAAGETKIIVGTHALLQERITFKKIGLLVVDEQHRFGVKQRMALLREQESSLVPHLLSMTATPIPRTLALAFYGDLDISVLKELPQGRKKIVTRLVKPEIRKTAYAFVRKEINNGRQAYVVTPLIEESAPRPSSPSRGEELKEGAKAATVEAEKLKKIFPEFEIGLLHGRLPGNEKKNIMDEFKSGTVQILVSTTVIEVGVDVPNATLMLIENAERFGLSQLHQLRGRVGRSDLQSYCLLFAENSGQAALERLEALVQSNDGFELAEIDLKTRGPGEVLGTKQSGYIPFRVAKLSDKKLIKQAKEEAQKLLEKHNLEDFPILKQKVENLAKNAHLE